ncbi:hypothetical protein IGL28_000464 [Enterococcus sp. AZ077]
MINHWKSVSDEGLFEEMGQYKRHVNNTHVKGRQRLINEQMIII